MLRAASISAPVIVARGRSTAQTAAVASIVAYTVAGDGTYEVSANLLITASTTFSISITVAFTDEGNTARTLSMLLLPLSGAAATTATNTGGAVPYTTAPQTIRCKSGTTITAATTGTFTTVTYNVEALIKQVSAT